MGSIQCPSETEMIVIGPDGPCEGGYAKIGTVITADFHLLGQVAQRLEIGGRMVVFVEVARDEGDAGRMGPPVLHLGGERFGLMAREFEVLRGEGPPHRPEW